MVFTKVTGKIDKDNWKNSFFVTEFGGEAIVSQQISPGLSGVLLPIMSNHEHHKIWGEVETTDCNVLFNKIHASSVSLEGETQGEAALPIPVPDFLIIRHKSSVTYTDSGGKATFATLEATIMEWSKNIKAILKREPESYFREGRHPSPDAEIDFWNAKEKSLNAILSQLRGQDARRILHALDKAKSSYCASFSKLCSEVFHARNEAKDNVKYLRPLTPFLEKLTSESLDIGQLVQNFKPMIHVILLIWKHSKNYNTVPRLVVLVLCICNALIARSQKTITGEDLFNLVDNEESRVAIDKIKAVISLCKSFKDMFIQYKDIAAKECPNNPWRVQDSSVFYRLDSFLLRCYRVLEVFQTIVHLSRLPNVTMGSSKGEQLTESIAQIFDEFQKCYKVFRIVPYNLFDVESNGFDLDFKNFTQTMKELEQRLASIVILGIDNYDSVMGKLKVLDSFDSALLARPTIHEELEKKKLHIVNCYCQDLKEIQKIYVAYHTNPPTIIARNIPPISASLIWSRGLLARSEGPMTKLRDLNQSVLAQPESLLAFQMYSSIISTLEDFEEIKVNCLINEVERKADEKLRLPLLTRSPQSQELVTNFDPCLVRLLREVKYFLSFKLDVSDTARALFASADTFRKRITALDSITMKHNNAIKLLRPIEKPLLAPFLREFNGVVNIGVDLLNWTSEGVDQFIESATYCVNQFYDCMNTVNSNFESIETIISQWAVSLIGRTSAKPVEKDDFERDSYASMQSTYKDIAVKGKEIHTLVKSTRDKLRIDESSDEWKAYLTFVNTCIIDGLSNCVKTTLNYFLEQIDPTIIKRKGKLPLLEVKLDLKAGSLVFSPTLESSTSAPGMRNLVDNLISKTLNVAALVNRVDRNGDCLTGVQNHPSVQSFVSIVNNQIDSNREICNQLFTQYDQFSDLWVKNVDEEVAIFCAEASTLVQSGTRELDYEKFTNIVHHYSKMHETIVDLKSSQDIGWLRVDLGPAKKKMADLAEKWKVKFMAYMRQNIVDTIIKHHEFVDGLTAELHKPMDLKSFDERTLIEMMSVIRVVKNNNSFVIELFRRQGVCLKIMRTHGSDNSSMVVKGRTVQDFLEEGPTAWESLVKKCMAKREELSPLQSKSIETLQKKINDFDLEILEYREQFSQIAPFHLDGSFEVAKGMMDKIQEHLQALENEEIHLRESQELFELEKRSFPLIAEMQKEINNLSQLWIFKSKLQGVYNSWKDQLWSVIKFGDLEYENEKLRKDLVLLGNYFPPMRGWQVFKDISVILKNTGIVLPLLRELHSQAMRPRHWIAVAAACNVGSLDPTDPNFSLKSMFSLELHTRHTAIEDIVERAAKELKIENILQQIQIFWDEMSLDYVQHGNTGVLVPKPSEKLLENVETHQMDLQGVFGMGMFMDYFREKVESWQRHLCDVDETLKQWMSVGKSWGALESIFLSSQDIRTQLPDDTRRFEEVDMRFRKLMSEAISESNCIKVCSVQGRFDVLRDMRAKLDICQKSLNDYLDVKKKVYPRFYFVSSVAVLDMLANGTDPPKIMQYLGDCYDALADLKYVQLENGEKSKNTVYCMIAKDGETASLAEHFKMEGEVENYLNQLTCAMQKALKVRLSDALEKASSWGEEAPRHEWLFQYPAQLCITGAQIMWTYDTQQALEEYEGGQDDAVKRYFQVCKDRLSALIQLVLGELTASDRTKIISLITMDVHSRDVLENLVAQKVEGPLAFSWQQQLRFYADASHDVNVRICDFSCKYFYEWVGNTGRLVITPLTDRCYITLTMGLKLNLGGAPAGPAGTGKTETTKDLARALAIPCYVFNCSDQMNFESMADIFRGLAQTGAWGCFDEFNRIPIEVLSVVATQVKTILDAIVQLSRPERRDPEYQHLPAGSPPVKVGQFEFMGGKISLIPSCGFWITMNPGYAGRTELPENLKALFRSCAMIRPDMKLIQENMLMAEGFQNARALSVKFHTLYELSSALLSKQPHYDWGLRSVKSVLRVAGGMKRANPDLDESQVLMRALRDFNTPKIPASDLEIFKRLIKDIFIGLEVSSKVDEVLKLKVEKVAKKHELQSEDRFVEKVCNFQELLDVRHSVMLLGPAGCGKSTIWQTLQGAINLESTKAICVSEVVNPKAVIGDELYGYMSLSKEWKDGVLSIIMRGMSKNIADQGFHGYQTSKWVVLDGDIDAVWIESMNTVMDDNKVLTLVSNERVPLSPAMRMVFEINSLKNATPATVSRAGILYINEGDIGWKPLVETWIQRKTRPIEASTLPKLFDDFVDHIIRVTRRGYKEVTKLRLINKVSSLIYLLESILTKVSDDRLSAESIEMIFAFAAMWSFGGAMIVDKSEDCRKKFSEEFRNAKYGAKIPKEGLCFDYFYCPDSEAFLPWESKVPTFIPKTIGSGTDDISFDSIFVETSETVRMNFLLEKLTRINKQVMFAGNVGTGKTRIMKKFLSNLSNEDFLSKNIVMSYYTTSLTLQREIESYIDKRSGTNYGPPMGKKMILFVDDINLPFVETYGTQNSIALLTQHLQHGSIFDRDDLGVRKHLQDIQYFAAMNPTAGSFEICERCQRHFSTFSISMPSMMALNKIFASIVDGHLSIFKTSVQGVSGVIVKAAAQLHNAVASTFLPSAIKFMYNWNMRDISNVFKGFCRAHDKFYSTSEQLVALFVHESQRVYSDRLISKKEEGEFGKLFEGVLAKMFADGTSVESFFSSAPIFTDFVASPDGAYVQVCVTQNLSDTLGAKLDEYNEQFAVMDLVLFEDAMIHVSRISRIIKTPGGHAMLIGVGGSGKQSLARLASFIVGCGVKQLSISSNFTVADLREEFKSMFRLAGGKNTPTVFLMTDAQIVDEKFLVDINSILTADWISDLFTKEEMDQNISLLANDAKALGIPDDFDARTCFFKSRIRTNLHLVLAFSPVGQKFRVRARRFPGLVTCTVIDQYHPWPNDALVNVAKQFMEKNFPIKVENEYELKSKLACHMAEQHLTVEAASELYLKSQKRYNYVTPKSFIELIAFFKKLLLDKQEELQKKEDRLQVGLNKLEETAKQVDEVQKKLDETMVEVESKKKNTDELIQEVKIKSEQASEKQQLAKIESDKADVESKNAEKLQNEANEKLMAAEPAMKNAEEAVQCLKKDMLTELKNLGKPPDAVVLVTSACLILLEGEFNLKNHTWDRAKKMMQNIDAFLKKLREFDKENIDEKKISSLEKNYLHHEENSELFQGVEMKKKSEAAYNLCLWIRNIHEFHVNYVTFVPLEKSAAEAKEKKAQAEAKLSEANATKQKAEDEVRALEAKLNAAQAAKEAIERKANELKSRANLAQRLINGLASENDRWNNEIKHLQDAAKFLAGDCMLAAGFVSYAGAFDQEYRIMLWKQQWTEDLLKRQILLSECFDPLSMLTDVGNTAKLVKEGLPNDRVSIENGAIITNCQRWPLIIDPQMQGIKWLKNHEEQKGVDVIQLSANKWTSVLKKAMSNGTSIIIENLSSDLDATLDPVLSRATYKKGNEFYLSFAGEEVLYQPHFQLCLQTRMANPHYKPEIFAQCTLVNFIATERGLEDQLLALVVEKERSELETKARELTAQALRFKIELVAIENLVLQSLSDAPEDILSDVQLVESLENAQKTKKVINLSEVEAAITQQEVNEAREAYRPVASEGAMLYFLLTKLHSVDHMYQYSLDSFLAFFNKSFEKAAEKGGSDFARVKALRESLRITIFTWVTRGLFERHKLILTSQLTFNLLKRQVIGDEEWNEQFFQFLLIGPSKLTEPNPIPWLPDNAWYSVLALGDIEEMSHFKQDLIEASPRFREWFDSAAPENEKLPLDWAKLDKYPLKKMLLVRCLRPDRMVYALNNFVRVTLPDGNKYADCDSTLNSVEILDQCIQDSSPQIPIYFILSPGANVAADLDIIATKYQLQKGVTYHNVSMGQGQDVVATSRLELAHHEGHWVILNNIHLMPKWLSDLEKKLDHCAEEKGNENFRLFLTSDPSGSIPIGILNRCIKLTNEPPTGLRANLKRAWQFFSKESIEESDPKTKSIMFGLCYFHSIMMERKMFGPMGFNMKYPFSIGDLRDSAKCLQNYMDNSTGSKIPWQDLKYIFGEIMYGGHIVNDFDRLLTNEYLNFFMKDELLGEMELFPFSTGEKKCSFMTPVPTSFEKYVKHIDNNVPNDTPVAFGLHPNAEIDFRTQQSISTFAILLDLQPRGNSCGGEEATPQQIADAKAADFLEQIADKNFDVEEIKSGLEEIGPYQNVFLQEMDFMNALLAEIKRSIKELQLGFAGELTMSDSMEGLMMSLYRDELPASWAKRSWPSLRALASWTSNFLKRISHLEEWMDNPGEIPKVTWLSGLVNPTSFLTAICQVTAQKNSWELDKLVTFTEVTKRMNVDEMDAPSRDGAYVIGLSMQGARWDLEGCHIERSLPRELFCPMPIMNVKAVMKEKASIGGVFNCPVYMTEVRGPTWFFNAQLKTKSPPSRWVLAGVALIADIA